MKQKLTLLLLALVTSIGAWATVTMPTLTTDANNPTYYVIQNYRSGKYANYAGESAQLTQVESASAGVTVLWYFVENGSGVSIVPASAPSLKLATTSSATADGAVWYLPENPYKAGTFCVSLTSDATANCWDDQSSQTTIGYWQPSASDNEGTSWYISEIPVSKAEVDAGTVNLTFALSKLDILARLAPLSGLSVYTDANVAAVRNAADETALNTALEAFETNISVLCRSGKYLVVGESACSFVETPIEYNQVIQLESAGSGCFYLKGYKSKKYIGQVRGNAAVNTTDAASTSFYFQSYNGYTVIKDQTGDDYAYIHNGGSGCVGWVSDAENTQHTIAEVELPAAFVNVTYHLMVGGVDKAQTTVECGVGDAPDVSGFFVYPYTTYTYDVETIAAGTTDVYATAVFDMPFEASTDYASATWYYLHGHATYSNYFVSTNDAAIVWNTTFERDDAHKWAFIGNPCDGIMLINKATGDGKYLTDSDNSTTMTTTSTSWVIKKQTAGYTNGGDESFGLWSSSKNTYANCAGGTVKYWTLFDQGSTFWIAEDVDAVTSDKTALAELITSAQALVTNKGIPGYINSTAAATLSTAITAAQAVYDDASGDYGSAYSTLASAVSTATVPANINYTPRTDVYYTIVNARGAMVYDPSHSESVDATNDNAEYIWYGSTTPDASNPNNLWGFIENEGNYYMYNVGKKQFASVGTGTYGSTWIFSNTPAYITLDDGIADEIVPPGVRVRATIATTGNSYTMSVSTDYTGPVITYDENGDGGVPMIFAESTYTVSSEVTTAIEALLEDVTPYRNALKEVIDGCASIDFGIGLNQYSANDAYTTALNAANAAYANDGATKEDLQTAKTNLESAISGLSINQPTAGGFLRVRSVSTDMGYINAETVEVENHGSVLAVGNKGKSSIYYYQDGKLLAYSCGQYFIKNDKNFASLGEVGADGTSIVFGTGTQQRGTYTVIFGGRYLYAGDSATNTDAGGSEGNAHYDFWLEQVTELPVTINSIDGHGFASFYSPVGISSLPDGVKAYKATLTTDRVQFSEITSIPANTGVVLYMPTCDANTTVNLTIGTASADADGNVLQGTAAAIALGEQKVLTMQNGTNGIGFYKFNGANLAGFKAYINISDIPNNIKGFAFDFEDDATSMNEELRVKNEESESAIYNLAGQRLSKMQKGINIVNGKKVMVK